MQPIKCFYVWQLSDKNAFFVGVYCLTNHQIDLDARYLVSPKNPQKTRKLEIRIKFTILKVCLVLLPMLLLWNLKCTGTSKYLSEALILASTFFSTFSYVTF